MSPEKPPFAMKVDVHLPSGDGCSVAVAPKRLISEVKAAAQQHFQRRLKLTAKGQQLDLTATLSEAGLRDGDVVAAAVQLCKLAATSTSFAWHSHGGEVVTWGDPARGGDISQMKEQLRNVQHIQATAGAFAAILESGAAVTWGDLPGRDSSREQEQLKNVRHIKQLSMLLLPFLNLGLL